MRVWRIGLRASGFSRWILEFASSIATEFVAKSAVTSLVPPCVSTHKNPAGRRRQPGRKRLRRRGRHLPPTVRCCAGANSSRGSKAANRVPLPRPPGNFKCGTCVSEVGFGRKHPDYTVILPKKVRQAAGYTLRIGLATEDLSVRWQTPATVLVAF